MGDMTVPGSSAHAEVSNSFLHDKLEIAKELNAELKPLYEQQRALSIGPTSVAIPEGEKGARAELAARVDKTMVAWESDHRTRNADEIRDGDKIGKRLNDIINNPAYKLADVAKLVDNVLTNPNGNTDYLGGDGHVAQSILTQISEQLKPLDVAVGAVDAERKGKLNEVNQQIADLKAEYMAILGTAAPVPSANTTTYNTIGNGNSSSDGDDTRFELPSSFTSYQPYETLVPIPRAKQQDEGLPPKTSLNTGTSSVKVNVSLNLPFQGFLDPHNEA